METNNSLAAVAEIQAAEVQRIMGEAPQTLAANRLSVDKAVQAADALLENARNVGMSDALDGEMASYIVKAKRTVGMMNDRRKPFTQLMDAIKKELTTLESTLKSKVEEMQQQRDAFATIKMDEQRKREQEAQLKLTREREAIDLAKQAEIGIASAYSAHLREAKELMMDKFNAATLDNFDGAMDEIEGFAELLTKEVYGGFRVTLQTAHHAPEDTASFVSAAMNKMFKSHVEDYRAQIAAFKRELLDKKISKLSELQAIKTADAEKRTRLEEECRKREDADRQRVAFEEQERQAKAAAAAESAAAGAAAHAEIAALAEVGTAASAQAREALQITINDPAGNIPIVQTWFMNEGKSLSQDKIDRVTFERMRKFCEKHALTTGEMIDSPFISYTEIFRAK